ncbi:MAG: NUDIX domain-containing protein [Myxococcales bacterium]|nr:NUDIX domain-containing protein [Myxococcales bacterium]
MHDDTSSSKVWAMAPRAGVARAYGGVLLSAEGKVLLRAPTGRFGGYAWTFAKGRPDPGETPAQAALREVREETGVVAEIVGVIEGWFRGDTTDTCWFVMRPIRETGQFDHETAEVAWVDWATAREMVQQTTSDTGRARDLALLDHVRPWLAHVPSRPPPPA